ncbi:MAG: MMPL family transporter [Dehalococcoidia bacterium]|nr:MMPL family transporter [Dehalococcoidia bacterium]
MYAFISRISERFKWCIALFWVALAAILFLVAPNLSDVGVTDQSQFLPSDTESAMANALIKDKFASADQKATSSGLLVIHNADGLSAADMQQAGQLHDWLVSDAAPDGIVSVVSVYESDALGATLISADGTTMLMTLDFAHGAIDPVVKDAIRQIRSYVGSNFPDSEIYFSGDAGLMNDLYNSVQQTVDRTTLVTLILVTVLLLIVYRSPVAILLPLITIGCSYLVAIGLLGFMAQAGMQVPTLAEAYLVVIIFGVGTDYCLFMVSRFREELAHSERSKAQHAAICHIGPVLAASALTVIVVFLSLGISRFGMNQTTGYAMALGVAVTLLAGLTLTPALISIFGRNVFWPVRHLPAQSGGRFGWHAIGKWVAAHPTWVAVPITLLLLLPYFALPRMSLSAGVVDQMPQNVESVSGFNHFNERFPAGEFSPLYLMVQLSDDNAYNGDISYGAELALLAGSLMHVEGVSRVDFYNAPVAGLQEFSVQIQMLKEQLLQGVMSDTMGSLLSMLGDAMQALALQYPTVIQSQNFATVAGALQQMQTAGDPTQIVLLLTNLVSGLNGLTDEFNLAVDTVFSASIKVAYFSADNTVARINVILHGNPYATAATNTVDSLRDEARTSLTSLPLLTQASASSYLGGEPATRADMLDVNNSDFVRVAILAVIGILIVIILLLRSLLAPLYMILTVLLNYGTTLGIVTWLFITLMHNGSIVYMIPLFIFVILVALGADYNIFLMSRIREEAHKMPIKDAVANAVGGTGGVITACGIILAGTFATLMTSSMPVVFQIGAAIGIGILIDTFLVRALLVPAIATILGRYGWWPSRLSASVPTKKQR